MSYLSPKFNLAILERNFTILKQNYIEIFNFEAILTFSVWKFSTTLQSSVNLVRRRAFGMMIILRDFTATSFAVIGWLSKVVMDAWFTMWSGWTAHKDWNLKLKHVTYEKQFNKMSNYFKSDNTRQQNEMSTQKNFWGWKQS